MRNFNYVLDRVEREIEEIMGEKKWTPQHAKALEELLMCEKCVKEIEKLAHAKKRMMGLPAPTEEEDEEMMQMPWHYEGGNYARGGNRGGGGRSGGNRGGNNYESNYEQGNYEQDNYAQSNYNYASNRGGRPSNYHYPKMTPPYEPQPPYMEEEMMMDPMMRHKMPLPYMYGGSPYNYGWDPMMEERELWKKRRSKGRYEDDDDEEEEERKKRKGNYENANSVGTPSTDSSSGSAKPR